MPDDIITGACYLIPPQVSGAWLIAQSNRILFLLQNTEVYD